MTAANEIDDLPPPTAPDSLPFSMRGFATVDDANRIANHLASYIRLISRCVDLSRLDGVTVAYDYDAALAELDRGVEGLRTLARSNDDQLIGVGMAPAVIRDGTVKVHVVLNGPYVEGIEKGDSDEPCDEFSSALYLLAHECAHVQVTTDKDRAFPKVILQHVISSYEEAIFMQVNEACWEEYAACRLSAIFGRGHLTYYEEGLRGVLGVARERAATAREAFWAHGDLDRAVAEIAPPLAQPLRLAAYVLGHIDGLDDDVTISEETRQAIAAAGYTEFLDDLAAALRTLWDDRHDWTHLHQFGTIGDVARDVFWSGGLLIRPAENDGATIHVWEPEEVDPVALGLEKSWASQTGTRP
jgi:hypothetical protein